MGKFVKIWEVLNAAIDEEMERDSKVFVIGEEVGKPGGVHKVTTGLQAKYGVRRVVDAPISEIGFTGLAVGAAFMKLKPIVEYMTWNFSLQAIDIIINSAAKTLYMTGGKINCPIVFRGPNGYNPGYAAQHTHDFSAIYGSVPGLKVVAPFTASDYYGLLKSAIRDLNPVIFLENESVYNQEWMIFDGYKTDFCQELDKAKLLQIGSNISLIGVSISVDICLKVSEILSKDKIGCDVINLISIRPIDYETILKSVKKTKLLVVIDYNWPQFGIASEISSVVSERLFGLLKGPVLKICGEDIPSPYAQNLEELAFPDVPRSLIKIREFYQKYNV